MTAVEYLVKELSEILGPLETQPMQNLLMVDAIKKAKEMFEQQIIDAHNDGHNYYDEYGIDSEEYYNETFKNK